MKFEITYTDPETGERKTKTANFESEDVKIEGPGSFRRTVYLTARQWAEDYAYTLGDKATDYEIREILAG